MKAFSLILAAVALLGLCGVSVACPPVGLGGVSAIPQAQFGYGMQQFAQFEQPMFAQAPVVYQQPVFAQAVYAAPMFAVAPQVYQQVQFAQQAVYQQPMQFAASPVFLSHGRHARIASRRAFRRAGRHGVGVAVGGVPAAAFAY